MLNGDQIMNEDAENDFNSFLSGYCASVSDGMNDRWGKYKPEIYDNNVSETVGGLLARQATLAVEFAGNPGIWNPHIAPLILRCMTEAHITLAWILEEPSKRSREYIRFGLGQEKLFIEYLENESDSMPEGEEDLVIEKMVEVRKDWLHSQLQEWAIEINVGSWSGKSARVMAQEAGCESLYKFVYVPFSGPVHNMWQHVGIYNVEPCVNPLHKYHKVPVVSNFDPHPDFLYRSSKYVSRTYKLIEDKLGLVSDITLPVDYFAAHWPNFGDEEDAE